MMLKLVLFSAFLFTITAWADKDISPSTLKVRAGDKELRFSGYIDGYYAHDFSNPVDGEKDFDQTGGRGGRQFTSNPLYDRQLSLGYGFFQVEFEHKNVGFRAAHQFGDIVQKMYANEPERLKQWRELTMNFHFNERVWLEVGYMPSIFGFETFINKDNMHASRSYMNDFAPDYDAGARLYIQMSKNELLKFQVTNGWQVMRDNNKQKALGAAYVYTSPGHFLFNWGQFFGDETNSGVRTSYRWYNNIFAKIQLSDRWIIAPQLDLGWQQELHAAGGKSWAPWQSYGGSVRYAVTQKHGVAARYERTWDPHNIIPELMTFTKNGWNHNGYTLTYEYLYSQHATFRIEGRYVKSRDAVFKSDRPMKLTDEDSFVMSQMALSF